jgi:curved DNA-binding protein CbpA
VAGAVPAEAKTLARLLDELDYYQLLEIPRDASASQVRRAYHDTSRKWHPDVNRHLAPEMREAAEQIAKRVAEAYSVLRDTRRRRVYDQRMGASGTPLRMALAEAEAQADRSAVEERVGTTPNGRRFFLLATTALQQGDLASAARNLQTALTFEPSNPVFRARLDEVRAAQREHERRNPGPPPGRP